MFLIAFNVVDCIDFTFFLKQPNNSFVKISSEIYSKREN